jgi:hypothetical protein
MLKHHATKPILHLNFIKGSHGLEWKAIASFLVKYGELDRKINKFIRYVEKG